MSENIFKNKRGEEMGRRRVELKKIENKTYRQISFSKRKSGLVKKAYELSTLCDIDISLILFSPSGKLFLYDGKKRFEEILQQYIDVPEKQRGRLSNQERVGAMIAQLSLEWSTYQKERANSSQGSIEADLEARQKEIDFCSSELEEVERQLMFFVGHSSFINTLAEAENHEEVLEESLRLLQMRKKKPHLKDAILGSSNMSGSSNYNFNPHPQFDPNVPAIDIPSPSYGIQPFSNVPQSFDSNLQPLFPPMDIPFSSNGFQIISNEPQSFNGNLQSLQSMDMPSSFDDFQPISNEVQSFDENLHPPPTGLQRFPMDMGINVPNNGPDLGANVPQLELGELANHQLPGPMDFTAEKATTSTNAVQSKVGDSPLCLWYLFTP